MKYICLSFDDARSDTYNVAFPILKKNHLKATVNVVSDFVFHPESYHFSKEGAMTGPNLIEWQNWGGEVALHGSKHQNTVEDILRNKAELETLGIDTSEIGFASPTSWLTRENAITSGIQALKDNGMISYMRSGIQVRREGKLYLAVSMLEMLTHSAYLYFLLNRRCIFQIESIPILLPSAAVKSYTTLKQIEYTIGRMHDGDALILMFHSILDSNDSSYGADYYFWDAEKFDKLCAFLANCANIEIVTTKELIA